MRAGTRTGAVSEAVSEAVSGPVGLRSLGEAAKIVGSAWSTSSKAATPVGVDEHVVMQREQERPPGIPRATHHRRGEAKVAFGAHDPDRDLAGRRVEGREDLRERSFGRPDPGVIHHHDLRLATGRSPGAKLYERLTERGKRAWEPLLTPQRGEHEGEVQLRFPHARTSPPSA